MVPILVFSDLDGTLLDHNDYRWDHAQPALNALRQSGSGVVLATSKTAAEVIAIRDEMGLADWPSIVENGAGVLPSHGASTEQPGQYQELRTLLNQMPAKQRKCFRGFGDMGLQGIIEVTGLAPAQAALAMDRAYSEPGLWTGSAELRQVFIEELSQHKVAAREGGRFLTLSFGQTKADCMHHIIRQYNPQYTVALGDAPNDVEMLQRADLGVIVANPARAPLPTMTGEAHGQIVRTELAGPAGWNSVMMEVLERFK